MLALISVFLSAAFGAGGASAQGEHARRAAAELRVFLGDARRLADEAGLSTMHRKGLEGRVRGSLSALPILIRMSDQETGKIGDRSQGAFKQLHELVSKGDWAGTVRVTEKFLDRYPLRPLTVSAGEPRAREIHGEFCAGCHDDPDQDTERPAFDLFVQAKRLPADEFLARMIIGVRGDRVTGISNPLSDPELKAMIDYYRLSNKN